jgi:hypothetical protein
MKPIDNYTKVLTSESNNNDGNQSNILFNIKDKVFITADEALITTSLRIKDKHLYPNLVLPFNPITFEASVNFLQTHPGKLRITIDESGRDLSLDVIRPNFMTSQIKSFQDLNRIIQFPKDNENPEDIIQWESLKDPIRSIYELEEDHRQTFTADKQKFFWSNAIKGGFIICGINQVEKTLIFTTDNIKSRTCLNIPKSKKWTIDIIARIWPEIKLFSEISGDIISISINKLPQLTSSDRNGVFRITKYHTSRKIHIQQTHIGCC